MNGFTEQLKSKLAECRATIEAEEQLKEQQFRVREQQFRAARDLVGTIGTYVACRLLQSFASAVGTLAEKPGKQSGPMQPMNTSAVFTSTIDVSLPVKKGPDFSVKVRATIKADENEPVILLEIACCHVPPPLHGKPAPKNFPLYSEQFSIGPVDPTLVVVPTELLPKQESLDKYCQAAAEWYKAELTTCAIACLRAYCREKFRAG